MDRPGARPADITPESTSFPRERRRARRHQVFTPAYANLIGSSQGAALELSEILNISESGMCIQASAQMKVNRLLPLGIDLSETGAHIRVVGHVVWSEPSGKTGIRFPDMPDAARAQLKQWLVANDKARTSASPVGASAPDSGGDAGRRPIQAKPTSASGYTSLVNEWAEIEKEVELCGPDLEPALHIIAQRALTLTWASGTAIALINKLNPAEMVCRARAGTDSPELGARLEAGSGFSGQCVRTATTLKCDDSEYDSRVDRNSCRALGIRSIVACPVKRNHEVMGILEVFSPEPAAFWDNDLTVLDRLTVVIERAVRRAEHTRADVLAFPLSGDSVPNSRAALPFFENAGLFPARLSMGRKILLLLTAIVCVTAVIWLVAPWIANIGSTASDLAAASRAEANDSHDTYVSASLKDLKKLAAEGNAAAEYSLGMRYANAEGVKQDYREAEAWFLRAAGQGNVRAQGKVAACFWSGKGTQQDYSRAYFWALLAQAGGDEASPAIVMSSAAHMSPAQTAAEQKQAEKWLHDHHIGHSTDAAQ